ncbi:MAG: DUF4382 domain-containing protein [Vulcanimicrobiaceae bacterium]
MDRKTASAGLALLLLSACGGGSSGGAATTPSTQNATMNVAMVDAPFQMSGNTVTAVNLGIDKVEVVGNGASPTVIQSFSTPDVVNILNYTSISAPLSFTGSIPAGSYQQIRLVLDTATTTIAYTDSNGMPHTAVLTVPSGTTGGFGNANSTDSGDGSGTSGLKVNVSLTAVGGSTYGFVLDFNADQSIVETGNGNFMLKPVIVATAQATSGSLTGSVVNQAGTAVAGAEVEALQGTTVVNTGVTDANGNFAINALPAGTYTLEVLNTYTTLAGTTATATGFDASVGNTLMVTGTITVTAGANAAIPKIID